MRYKTCPGCKGMNRDTDRKCFQCGESLDARDAPAPVGGAPASRAEAANLEGLPIVDVLTESLQLFWKTLPKVAAAMAVLTGVGVLLTFVMLLLTLADHPGMSLLLVPGWAVLVPVFWATHMRLMLAGKRDERCSLGQALQHGLARGLSLCVTIFMLWVLIVVVTVVLWMVLGRTMLIVALVMPLVCLLLGVRYFLFIPCSVLEDHLFFSGFSRSSQLVNPHYLRVAVLAILSWCLGSMLSAVPQMAASGALTTVAGVVLQSQTGMPFMSEGAEPSVGTGVAALLASIATTLVAVAVVAYLSVLGGTVVLVVPFVVYWRITRGRSLSWEI